MTDTRSPHRMPSYVAVVPLLLLALVSWRAGGRRFYGAVRLMDSGPVQMAADLLGGKRGLAGISETGWSNSTDPQLVIVGLGAAAIAFVLAALVFFFACRRGLLTGAMRRGTVQKLEGPALYDSLFESSPNALFVVGEDGKILNANQRAVDLYGHSKPQLLEMSFSDLAAPPMQVIAKHVDITERKLTEDAGNNSEALYRDLVETSQDLIWQCDAEGRYTYLNAAWEDVFGCKIEEMLGRPFVDFQSPAYAERDRAEFARLLGGSTVTGLETVHIAKDGRPIHLVFNAKALWNKKGEIAGTRGTAYDITARKRDEEALRESENRLALFIDHAPAALAMFDRDMRYIAASRRWCNDYVLGARELLGQSHYDVFPEISDDIRAVHRRAMAGEVLSSDDDRFERADGTVQWVRWEVRPWYSAGGAVGGIVVFSEDITARKEMEEALRESEERYRTILAVAPVGIIVHQNGRIVFVNPAGLQVFGR